MMGPCRALFYQGSPEISLAGSISESIWGSMYVQEGPLSLGRVGQCRVGKTLGTKELSSEEGSWKWVRFDQTITHKCHDYIYVVKVALPSPLKRLLWLYFWEFHNIIPWGHKWKAWCQKSPLALKLLVLEPKQNSDPVIKNEPISRFCYLKMGDFRLSKAVKIKPRHVERYFFF